VILGSGFSGLRADTQVKRLSSLYTILEAPEPGEVCSIKLCLEISADTISVTCDFREKDDR
jgi:hypothetical protein